MRCACIAFLLFFHYSCPYRLSLLGLCNNNVCLAPTDLLFSCTILFLCKQPKKVVDSERVIVQSSVMYLRIRLIIITELYLFVRGILACGYQQAPQELLFL